MEVVAIVVPVVGGVVIGWFGARWARKQDQRNWSREKRGEAGARALASLRQTIDDLTRVTTAFAQWDPAASEPPGIDSGAIDAHITGLLSDLDALALYGTEKVANLAQSLRQFVQRNRRSVDMYQPIAGQPDEARWRFLTGPFRLNLFHAHQELAYLVRRELGTGRFRLRRPRPFTGEPVWMFWRDRPSREAFPGAAGKAGIDALSDAVKSGS